MRRRRIKRSKKNTKMTSLYQLTLDLHKLESELNSKDDLRYNIVSPIKRKCSSLTKRIDSSKQITVYSNYSDISSNDNFSPVKMRNSRFDSVNTSSEYIQQFKNYKFTQNVENTKQLNSQNENLPNESRAKMINLSPNKPNKNGKLKLGSKDY